MISGAAAAAGVLARSGSLDDSLVRDDQPAVPEISPAETGPIVEVPATSLDPNLLRRALAALDQHAKTITLRDRIAIVDFSAPSSEARLHFLDVASGRPALFE